jgi:hypothetical protein
MNQHDENIEVMKDLRNRLDSVINKEDNRKQLIDYPDAVKHKYISFVKSGFRILAGIALCFGEFAIAGGLLIVAELLGIAEELV